MWYLILIFINFQRVTWMLLRLEGFTPEVQLYEPLPIVTGTAEFYFFTLSATTWTQTGNFLLFTLAMKRKDGQKNSHTWVIKKPTVDIKVHFYCFEHPRAALLQIPSHYMEFSLSGVHFYFTYFYRPWSLHVQVSAMTQSKYCVKPCRLNSIDLL